jgi:hypothetical protein
LGLPVEFRLELMAIVHCPAVNCSAIDEGGGSHECGTGIFDDMVNELDCIGLGVLAKALKSAKTRTLRGRHDLMKQWRVGGQYSPD